MLENSMIQAQERHNNRRFNYMSPANDACDVCDKYAAVVRSHRTLLCESCAKEDGIEVL